MKRYTQKLPKVKALLTEKDEAFITGEAQLKSNAKEEKKRPSEIF